MELIHRDRLQTLLHGAFGPQLVDSHQESVDTIRRSNGFKDPGFLKAFQEIILDPSRTWTEKIAHVFVSYDSRKSEEQNHELFKYMWNTVMEVTGRSEPWPLDPK